MTLSLKLVALFGATVAVSLLLGCVLLLRQILRSIRRSQQRERALQQRVRSVLQVLERSGHGQSSQAAALRAFLDQTADDGEAPGERAGRRAQLIDLQQYLSANRTLDQDSRRHRSQP